MKSIQENINGIPVCLSKGRKRQFFCNACGSSDIEELSLGGLRCNHCAHHDHWKRRLKAPFDGTPREVIEAQPKEAEHLTYERNHEPDQQGIWFDYTGFRYKDHYDIELMDGTIVEMCRPNGDGWYGDGERDNQVRRVRLKPDSELNDEYHITGQDRIDRNLEMFGGK